MLKTVGNPSTRSGDQTISNGNLVIGTAGKGIDFSADPSAPGMTSELLNDYEQGTWTPDLTPETGTFTTLTYSNRGGNYTKVGRQVTVTGFLWTSNVNTTGASGALRISGLPFTAASGIDYPGSIGLMDRWTFAADILTPRLRVTAAQTFIEMFKNTVNSTSATKVQVTDMTTGATTFRNEIQFTATYFV